MYKRQELDDTPTFLYIGGDSYVKGFRVLLQAMKMLGRQGIKAKFILTNKYSPESLSTLKRLNEGYKNLKIDVVGKVGYEKLLKIHRKVWALIFPSIWEEPLPYAIAESSVLDSIPIASKVGGVMEIVEGSTAVKFTFRPGDIVEAVEK